ncbi:MAG TPA: hypothetical protein VFT21_13895 [Gemmatimonadaceae bacterium]|nr:hypothetical protein [Gemmatimonadaceae bacterium]
MLGRCYVEVENCGHDYVCFPGFFCFAFLLPVSPGGVDGFDLPLDCRPGIGADLRFTTECAGNPYPAAKGDDRAKKKESLTFARGSHRSTVPFRDGARGIEFGPETLIKRNIREF